MVIVHKATRQHRDEQLRAFFNKLPKRESGRLTREGSAAWKGWVKQQGLSLVMANIIARDNRPRAPFNQVYAEQCTNYLKSHGYLVIGPFTQQTPAAP